MLVGEGLADDGRHAAQVAAPGHEGAQLHDGRAAGGLEQRLQRVTYLRREQAFSAQRRHVKDQPRCLGCHGRWRIFRQLQSLGDLLGLFLFRQ